MRYTENEVTYGKLREDLLEVIGASVFSSTSVVQKLLMILFCLIIVNEVGYLTNEKFSLSHSDR